MFDRRTVLSSLVATASGGWLSQATAEIPTQATPPDFQFNFCLNSSTVRDAQGKSRPLEELISIAHHAGYQALEPWIKEIELYVQQGGKLKELAKKIRDAGLVIPDAIGFPPWIVDDDNTRKKALEQARREMDMVQQLGGTHIAAPPVGYTNRAGLSLMKAAERYRDLWLVGKKLGVLPIVEVWGFSKSLHRLGETMLVAAEAQVDTPLLLPDVYHLYKGDSGFHSLKMLHGSAIGIFHINDYPAVERSKITDADRVYPGDGIAPLKQILTTLRVNNYRGFLSLELFNRNYWKQDPREVAKTGLKKLKTVIASLD